MCIETRESRKLLGVPRFCSAHSGSWMISALSRLSSSAPRQLETLLAFRAEDGGHRRAWLNYEWASVAKGRSAGGPAPRSSLGVPFRRVCQKGRSAIGRWRTEVRLRRDESRRRRHECPRHACVMRVWVVFQYCRQVWQPAPQFLRVYPLESFFYVRRWRRDCDN